MSQVVYTDGACRGNPGPGGWAWALDEDRWMSGAEAQSTNQRMEIMAAFRAVERLEGPLELRSDSTYVVKCFNDRWYLGWKARGWRNSQKQAVANRDLWEPFIDLVLARGDVRFTWVKGHSTDRMNQLVDRLAVEASRNQRAAAAGFDLVARSAAESVASASGSKLAPAPVSVIETQVTEPPMIETQVTEPPSAPIGVDEAPLITQESLF